MQTFQLLEDLQFHEKRPHAQPLLISDKERILRFMLEPHQHVREHRSPHSPVYILGLQGNGLYAGEDGVGHPFSPNKLVTFEPNELHEIRALNEPLVFLAILNAAPNPDR
jgi:quercetin dioxygenase-like cupin family protein